jgi:hypothetical protein
MTIDWAMQEALEEVDALTPAVPPVAPPRTPGTNYRWDEARFVRGQMIEVDCTPQEMAAYTLRGEMFKRGISPNSGLAMMNAAAAQNARDLANDARAGVPRGGRCRYCACVVGRYDSVCPRCPIRGTLARP